MADSDGDFEGIDSRRAGLTDHVLVESGDDWAARFKLTTTRRYHFLLFLKIKTSTAEFVERG
jgi:hypothetical protein